MKVGKQIFGWVKRGIRNLPSKAAGLYRKAILQPQIDMNKELADYSYDKNLEMWNLQNEYNSPSAQRQRMEEAGFNPNYMAGGGASSTGSASPASMPQYNVQAPNYDPMAFYSRIIQAANGIMGLRLSMANLRKTQGLTGKLGEETKFLGNTQAQRKMSIILKNRQTGTNADLGDQLLQFRGGGISEYPKIYSDGMFHKQRTALDAEIESKRADNVFKYYRNELARYGIYSSDNFLFRMGIQALDTIGLDPSSWLKSGSEGISNYLNSKRGR